MVYADLRQRVLRAGLAGVFRRMPMVPASEARGGGGEQALPRSVAKLSVLSVPRSPAGACHPAGAL